MTIRYSAGMKQILTSLLRHEPQMAASFGRDLYSGGRGHCIEPMEADEKKVAARNARRAVKALNARGDLTLTRERTDFDSFLPHTLSSWPIWCRLTDQGRARAAMFQQQLDRDDVKRLEAMTPDERAKEAARRIALDAIAARLRGT